MNTTATGQIESNGLKGWFLRMKKRGGRKIYDGVNFGATMETAIETLQKSSAGYGLELDFVEGREATLEDIRK